MSQPAVTVRDNPAENRFEAELEGHTAIAEYKLAPGVITFTHTLVPQAMEGRGVASTLARAALKSARDRQLKVVPKCEFFAGYISRHPEEQDLLQG